MGGRGLTIDEIRAWKKALEAKETKKILHTKELEEGKEQIIGQKIRYDISEMENKQYMFNN